MLGALFSAQSSEDFQRSLEVIRDDLTACIATADGSDPDVPRPSRAETDTGGGSQELEPADIHLLAVVHHALGECEAAKSAYILAIDHYASDIRQQDRPLLHILKALCHADLGELLLDKSEAPEEAAEQFQVAQRTMQLIAGPVETHSVAEPSSEDETEAARADSRDRTGIFQIYALCREADAWLSINHWEKADRCLLRALDNARSLAPEHYLTAHVHRRRAWAEIIQWRIREAESSFVQSNLIVAKLFEKELDLQNAGEQSTETVSAASLSPTLDEVAADSAAAANALTLSNHFFSLPPAYHQSRDFTSKIAYLHNLHGIAMARRFQGDTSGAARNYRELVGLVEATYSEFQRRMVDDDIHEQLLERIVNTQERLGDCNLFGNPRDRDLKEALDDYRRAMHRVHWLKDHRRRDRWTATLLYKQALALSLPSPNQDAELAAEMCLRADEIFSRQQTTATGLYRALGQLTTRVVNMAVGTPVALGESHSQLGAATELRRAILDFRDMVGPLPHRDELELALFSAKVLLDRSGDSDRYQLLEDADLLLSFCRIALAPYAGNDAGGFSRSENRASDSRVYLRPYYDTVMRIKLQMSRKDVRDLLELQREATQGTYYVKGEAIVPVLATYVLDDKCLLLFDLPGGDSTSISLADMYDVDRIREACFTPDRLLPLPRSIHDSLAKWWRNESDLPLNFNQWQSRYCWWDDPVHGFSTEVLTLAAGDKARRVVAKPPNGRFPFELPAVTTSIPNAPDASERTGNEP